MFYDNWNILMYKVIGTVIYTIIEYYICLDYLVFLQEKLSKHDNDLEMTKFNDFLGISCHVTNVITLQYPQLS